MEVNFEIPQEVLNKIPTQGSEPSTGQSNKDNEAAAKAAAEAATKAKADEEEKKKNEASKENNEGNEGEEGDDNELSEDEINSKLEELNSKKPEELTEEDKKFLDKYESPEEIVVVKKELEGTFGVKLEGDYSNGVDGLKSIVKDAVPQLVKQTFIESLQQIPYMKEFYEHVTQGKSIDTFLLQNTQPDVSKIDIKEVTATMSDTEKLEALNTQRTLLHQELMEKGMSKKDADDFVKFQEDTGKLFERAKEAKNNLVALDKQKREELIKQENEALAQREKDVQEIRKQAESIIDSNNFDGLQIPVEDIKKFKEAVFKPIDDKGNTLLAYKYSKLSLGKRLIIDYLVANDLKTKGLTQKKVEEQFSFNKANEENSKRGGSKVSRSSSKQTQPTKNMSVDLREFFNQIDVKQ